jgi:hypothetical protein
MSEKLQTGDREVWWQQRYDAANARIVELQGLLKRCQNNAADTWQKLVEMANARAGAAEHENEKLLAEVRQLRIVNATEKKS